MNAPSLSLDAVRALGRALRHATALPSRHIGARLRELVILHVASVNGCPVCSSVHGAVSRRAGIAASDIHEARRCAPSPVLDDPARVALRYAELRTRGQERDDPAAVEEFERTFSRSEQREIRAVVDLFTFNTRLMNTWEHLLPGAERRRERLELCQE